MLRTYWLYTAIYQLFAAIYSAGAICGRVVYLLPAHCTNTLHVYCTSNGFDGQEINGEIFACIYYLYDGYYP